MMIFIVFHHVMLQQRTTYRSSEPPFVPSVPVPVRLREGIRISYEYGTSFLTIGALTGSLHLAARVIARVEHHQSTQYAPSAISERERGFDRV